MRQKKKSLGLQLVIAFVITSIIPFVLINIFSYYNISKIVRDHNSALMEYNLNRTKTMLDVSIESYEDVLFQIYSNDTVVELINRINKGEELVVSKNQLRRILQGYFYAKEYIKDISVITENGTLVFYERITGYSVRSPWMGNQDMKPDELYQNIMDYQKTYFMPTKEADTSLDGDNYLFHMGHRIVDYNRKNKEIGAVIISIDEQMLSEICTDREDGPAAYHYIVDQKGSVVSCRKKEYLGMVLDVDVTDNDRQAAYQSFAEEQGDFGEESIEVNYTHDEKTGWDIVNVSDQEEVLGRIRQQQQITYTVLTAVIAALVLLILYLIRRLTHSIKSVVATMQSTGEGRLQERVEIDDRMPSEVEVIACQYNKTIDQLLDALEKEKRLDRQRKDAEITALEAQLNPHFLYNTLDTINWIAIGKKEFEISRAINALANILRYGIDNSNGIVTIREEYEWLKQYLLLQQTRLKEEFESQIDIPPELMEVRVHKLLIQPFIENSFVHGFEGVRRKCAVKVRMTCEDGFLKILIEDNGKGMPEQIIESVNSKRSFTAESKSQIGLRNAIYRIQLYYGDGAEIHAESAEGEYTKILLTIPMEEEMGEDTL